MAAFRDALTHWRSLGNPLSQITALRNLVPLLLRLDEAVDIRARDPRGTVLIAAAPVPRGPCRRIDGTIGHEAST